MAAYWTLGETWSTQGDVEKGIEYYEKAFAISSKSSPLNHEILLHLESRLAYMKRDQDLQASVKWMEEIVHRMKIHVGREHVGTINNMMTLSCMYTRQKRYKKAEDVLCEALEISQQLNGDSHELTHTILGLYSESLKHQGKSDVCYSMIHRLAPSLIKKNSPGAATAKKLVALLHWASETKVGEKIE